MAQFLGIIVAIVGTGVCTTIYLSNRIDALGAKLTARVDRVGDNLEKINKTLGAHDAEIAFLKEKKSA